MERGLEMANDKEETPEDIERTKEQHRQRLSEAIEESKKNNQNGNGKTSKRKSHVSMHTSTPTMAKAHFLKSSY